MAQNGYKKLLRALAVCALLGASAVLILRFMFVVRNVEVRGDTGEISAENVVRVASVGFGESIFRVDCTEIESRINATGILYLSDVQIHYPDTVELMVEKRSRVTMLLYSGKNHVLDGEGFVVESVDQVPNEDLIYVSGMQLQGYATGELIRAGENQLKAYQAVVPAICRQSAGMYVSELKLDDAENIRIVTRGGITVQLGDSSSMENKIAWMKSAVADLERRGESGGTLDVSSGARADYRPAD